MKTYCIAQGTLSIVLWWSKSEINLKKTGNVCICMADSLYCAAETNTTLKSNYTPIKSNF